MDPFETGFVIYGTNVDGKTSGAVKIFSPPQDFVVFGIQIVLSDSSGVILAPIVSIGTNASSYNNMETAIVLTPLSSVNNIFNVSMPNPGFVVEQDQDVYIKVNTAAIATTYTFKIIIIGYPI